MQFKLLTLAMAAASYAQVDSILASVTDSQALSIISVLETAIPTSVALQALTNPAGYATALVSQINDGQRPDWFTALPSDIQDFLVAAEDSSYLTSANATQVSTSSRVGVTSASMTPSMIDNSTTLATTSRRPSRTTSDAGMEATGGASQSSDTSDGGAQATKAVGMGVAGIVGLVGLWAL